MRIAALALVLATAASAQQASTPKAAPDQHHKTTAATSRQVPPPSTAAEFMKLFDRGVPFTLANCRNGFRAALTVTDELLSRLNSVQLEYVHGNIGICGEAPGMTRADLRWNIRAMYRISHAMVETSIIEAERASEQHHADEEQHKAAMDALVRKYNALVTEYNELNEANGQLFRTAQTLKLSVQQAQLECASATSQAYMNGVGAARKLDQYTPPPQPTVCRTELVGWDLVTKCK